MLLIVVLDAPEIELHPGEHLVILAEVIIPPVSDGVFVVVLDYLFVVQVAQDQLVDGLIVLLVNLPVALHQLLGLENVPYDELYLLQSQ